MPDFAVIQTGGKQYRVSPGQKLKIEKLAGASGEAVVFDKVLLRSEGDTLAIGVPYISGTKVAGKIIRQAKEDTKIVFKYHAKARYKKKNGHRQPFTEVEIVKI